jgi:hypothetical protein
VSVDTDVVGVIATYLPLLRVYTAVDCVWNVMAHAQKQDFVCQRNGRVHLNQRGRQFSRLLVAEVWVSALVKLDAPCSEVVWRILATPSIRQFPLHFPSRASPRAITFQLDSTHTHHGQIYCHNTDYVRINGHDKTITVILAKHSTELPDDGSFVIRNMLEQF